MQILNLNESKMNNKKSNNDLQFLGVKQYQYIIYTVIGVSCIYRKYM